MAGSIWSRRAGGARHPDFDLQLGGARQVTGLERRDDLVPFRRRSWLCADVQPARRAIDHYQRGGPVRVLDGKFERRRTANRAADEAGARHAQVIQQPGQVVAVGKVAGHHR